MPSKADLESHVSKKTSPCSCPLKMHELDSNSTLDGVTKNERLTSVINCMLYLKTHTETEKMLMLKTIFQLHLCRSRVLDLQQHVQVIIQTFSGGCDALLSHNSSLTVCHSHMIKTASGCRGPQQLPDKQGLLL